MADTRYITLTKWQSLTATEVTLPSGRKVSSGYDALYRRNTINETSGGAPIAAWQFFGDRTATLALGNGITCTNMNNGQTASAIQSGGTYPPSWGDKTSDRLGYDGSGRLIAKRFLPSGSTTALVGFTSEYDKSSNKLFERPLHAESRANLYDSYDSMNRLLEYKRGILASGGGSILTNISLPNTDQQRAYNLDGLGNWSTTVYTPEGGSSTTESRTHNKLNEVTAFGVSPSSTSVLYDHGNNPSPHADRGNGNIVNDGTRVYAYDALNRLTTVSSTASGTPQVAAYTYDALGRRVEKVVTNGGIDGSVADTTYRYLYDGQQIVEELLFDGSSYSTLRQFIWGQYVDELVQLNVPTTITTPVSLTAGAYYPLQDLLYRTTATTDGSGTIVEAYDYDAYGNTLMYDGKGTDGLWFTDDDVATDQPMCEFLFTGRQYDPETQIFWYRARYYHPMLGRFIGRDPEIYNRINLYEYVKSLSTTLTDPTGAITVNPLPMPGAIPLNQVQCGGMAEIYWDFTISAPAKAKCDGYIVQQVDYHCQKDSHCCKCPNTSLLNPTYTFWEAWFVKAGDSLESNRVSGATSYTDRSGIQATNGTCGNISSIGTIKFFCVGTTHDLGKSGQPNPASGWNTNQTWGVGDCQTSPGWLPSTNVMPVWWPQLSDDVPIGARQSSLYWNCCPNCPNNFVNADGYPI